MNITTERKCPQCSNQIILEDYDCLFYSSRFFHKQCFIEKMTTKKRGAILIDDAIELAEELRNKNIPKIKNIISKNHLYKWVQMNYDVNLPKKFFEKMAAIHDGSYYGLKKPIPAHHLFRMWKSKKDKLASINNNNKTKGKKIEGINLVYYDLAILVDKYPSYLKWIEKQKMLAIEKKQKETNRSLPKIDFKRVGRMVKNNRANEVDISKFIEEV